MKAPLIAIIAAGLLGSGCIYKEALVEINTHPINPSLLGLWEEIPENEESTDPDQLLVLKYSDTEYMVLFDDELYFRGYPIELGGSKCIQLQLIGSNKGDLANKKMKRFLVARTAIENDHLEIRMLDHDLVDDDLESTRDLARAFLKHKDNPKLFDKPGRFKRIKE